MILRGTCWAIAGGVASAAAALVAASCGGDDNNSHSAADGSAPEAGSVAPPRCGVGSDGEGVCVPVPAGWSAAAYRRGVPNGATLDPCPAGYQPVGSDVAVNEAAETVVCTAECNLGGVCNHDFGALTLDLGGPDGGCSDASTIGVGATCAAWPLEAGAASVALEAPAAQCGGYALQSTATHQIDEMCPIVQTGTGCNEGDLCVPSVAAPWSVAIFQPSARVDDGGPLLVGEECPATWVDAVSQDGGAPVALAVATKWDDTGVCTAPECGLPGGCTTASVTLYTDTACGDASVTFAPGSCQAVPANVQSASYSLGDAAATYCVVTQPSVRGTETPSPDAGYVVCYSP